MMKNFNVFLPNGKAVYGIEATYISSSNGIVYFYDDDEILIGVSPVGAFVIAGDLEDEEVED